MVQLHGLLGLVPLLVRGAHNGLQVMSCLLDIEQSDLQGSNLFLDVIFIKVTLF